MSSTPLVKSHQPPIQDSKPKGIFKRLRSICGGFHKYVLFGYFSPYMRLAKEQGCSAVRPDALPSLWASDDLVKWSNRFTASQSQQNFENPSKWELLYTLYRTFSIQFIGIFLLKIVSTCLNLASVFSMSRFLRWQEGSPESVTIKERNMGTSSSPLCRLHLPVRSTRWSCGSCTKATEDLRAHTVQILDRACGASYRRSSNCRTIEAGYPTSEWI